MTVFLSILGGLVLLIAGGELLVRGAVQAATILRVSPLVIGLTLVGFGTSTPELVTSIQASLAGAPAIAVGNIVGSNLANILLIIGAAALLKPIAVSSAALKRDGGVMLGTAVLFAVLCWFFVIDRLVGGAFVLALAGYVIFSFMQERQAVPDHGAAYDKGEAARGVDPGLTPAPGGSLPIAIFIAVAGLVLVVFGGRFLVDGATALARDFGISEAVIGLTIVAIGTSMPELVTSIVAAIRGQSDVAFGNIIGSNIYNILGIGGITAIVSPLEVPEQIRTFDNPYMIAATVLFVAFAWTGMRVGRREGALLLACYGVYLFSLWPK